MAQNNNKPHSPALRKAAVSSRYGLVKMKHKDRCGTSIFRLWHLLNESEVGSSEYTLCGLATPDSDIRLEDCEAEEYKRGGKITCYDDGCEERGYLYSILETLFKYKKKEMMGLLFTVEFRF